MYFLNKMSNFLDAIDNSIDNFYFSAVESIRTKEDVLEFEGLEFLYGFTANLRNRNSDGFTAIHYAIITGNNLAFEWLMQNPEINVTLLSEVELWNPAHCAVINRNAFALEQLVRAGVQLNQKDASNMTPLAFLEDDLNAESLLLSLFNKAVIDVDFNIEIGELNRSYAHFWARDSTLKLLESLLLGNSAQLNASDKMGVTPLMVAADKGQAAVIKLLLCLGADYGILDWKGRSALHLAAAAGHAEICKLLLFDPEAMKNTGLAALPDYKICSAADQNYSHNLLFTISNEGMSPLMEAVRNSHVAVVRVLLDHLDPSNPFLDLMSPRTGDTALHLAAKAESLEMVQMLLEKGVFADAVNFENKKPANCTENQDIIEAINFDI